VGDLSCVKFPGGAGSREGGGWKGGQGRGSGDQGDRGGGGGVAGWWGGRVWGGSGD